MNDERKIPITYDGKLMGWTNSYENPTSITTIDVKSKKLLEKLMSLLIHLPNIGCDEIYRKGELVKEQEGEWAVKYSETSSATHGTHWQYIPLSPNSIVMKYIENGKVHYMPLQGGFEIDFKIIIFDYDKETYIPTRFAELVFPKVEEFEKKSKQNENE